MMKKLGVLVAVGIGLMVSGCGSEEGISSYEPYDVSVDNDVETEINKVNYSLTYKEVIYEVVNEFNDYMLLVIDNISSNNITSTQKKEYTDLTVEYLNYINKIDPYSLNIDDNVLEQYFWDFDYHTTMVAEYALKFLSTNDTSNKAIIKDYLDDVVDDLTLMQSILEPTN